MLLSCNGSVQLSSHRHNQEGSVQVQKSINGHMQGCVSKRAGLLPVTARNTSTLLQQGTCSGCPSEMYLEELPTRYNVPAVCSYAAGLPGHPRSKEQNKPSESLQSLSIYTTHDLVFQYQGDEYSVDNSCRLLTQQVCHTLKHGI